MKTPPPKQKENQMDDEHKKGFVLKSISSAVLTVKSGESSGFGDLVSEIVLSNGKTELSITQDNAARLVDCYEAMQGIKDPAEWMEEVKTILNGYEQFLADFTEEDTGIAQLRLEISKLIPTEPKK